MVEIHYEPYPEGMTEQTDMIAEPATKRVLLAEPRGYCAGVDRAVETVERALEKHGAPLYMRKESCTTSTWWVLHQTRRDLRR